MELSHWEKLLIIEGLKDNIKNKEYLVSKGTLVNEMQEDINELNNLINKIKDIM